MSNRESAAGTTLTFENGHTITLKEYGTDREGEYLILEHQILRQGALNGPHRHPVLQERFSIVEGNMRFLIDGKQILAGPGEQILILPNQMHQAWKVDEGILRVLHVIRPPGLHWTMFELLNKLETEGKLNARGIPRNPLWLGLAWKTMDGYIAGPPRWVQRLVFGGLAKLAEAIGYRI
jgi:quercetin dioxygenase-like cupin family protein